MVVVEWKSPPAVLPPLLLSPSCVLVFAGSLLSFPSAFVSREDLPPRPTPLMPKLMLMLMLVVLLLPPLCGACGKDG